MKVREGLGRLKGFSEGWRETGSIEGTRSVLKGNKVLERQWESFELTDNIGVAIGVF